MLRNCSFLINEHENQLKEAARKIEKFLSLAENSCFLERNDTYRIGFYTRVTDLDSLKQKKTHCAEREDIFKYAEKLAAINLPGTVFYYSTPFGRVGGITFPVSVRLSDVLEKLITEITLNSVKLESKNQKVCIA